MRNHPARCPAWSRLFARRGDDVGTIAYWGISLLGAGALVSVGTLLRPTRRALGLTLLTVGALMASNATVWTLLLPILAVVTFVMTYRNHEPEVKTA